MNPRQITLAALSTLLWSAQAATAATLPADSNTIERGRYLARIGGCNDCHTPGYLVGAGKVPEQQWLTGNSVGFQGPWGTTYPTNLRLLVQGLSEAQWLELVRRPMRPPMPWFNLREMTDDDLIALYGFIGSLGAAGEPAPQFADPGAAVATPYYEFVPKNLPRSAKR